MIRIFIISLFVLVSLTACREGTAEEKSPCDGRQWKNSKESMDCHFPPPPIGRWKAVYTEKFAKMHSLPLENISTDLSSGVDYMEMDVQPYAKDGVACLFNMLIKKPNDVAVYSRGRKFSWGEKLHAQRKLTHFIDLEEHKDKLKDVVTFSLAPRNMKYDPKKSYGVGSSFAFYARDVLEDYDYITADAGCYYLLSDKSRFPDGWAFWVAEASTWGRYESLYKGPDVLGRPKGQEYFDTHLFINIPHELISTVFKGMPIGGQ